MANQKEMREDRVELHGNLAEFRTALEEEIEQIKKSGQSSTLLSSGRRIESSGTGFWYRFQVEYLPAMPADTPCKLIIGKESYNVIVISFEENAIIISSEQKLPDSIGVARLENGATVLMELLIKCIEENAEAENPAGNRMLPMEENGATAPVERIFTYDGIELDFQNTEKQNTAVTEAISNNITYIWGPPGTGKTSVIGQIIKHLYDNHRSVLVVSHTNTAVDGAIEKATKLYDKGQLTPDTHYPILRYGNPARPLDQRTGLDWHIKELGQQLYEQKMQLEAQRTEFQKECHQIEPDLARFQWIRESGMTKIRQSITKLQDLTVQIGLLRIKIRDLDAAIESEKRKYPDIHQIEHLESIQQKKSRQLSDLISAIQQSQNLLEIAPDQSIVAADEIKKHEIYADLCRQESKLLSAQFYKTEIEKLQQRGIELGARYAQLQKEQSAAESAIASYEHKNSVVKFFADKSAYLNAKTALADAISKSEKTKEELRQSRELCEEYEEQLHDLQLLLARKAGVTPSYSREYWDARLRDIKTKEAELKKQLPGLLSRKDEIQKEVEETGRRISQIKIALTGIQCMAADLESKRDDEDTLRAEISALSNRCREELEQELSLCSMFITIKEGLSMEDIFSALVEKLKETQLRIQALNYDELVETHNQILQSLRENKEELDKLQQKLQELEKQAILEARILGTTLTKTYISKTLRERTFDTVILDEASMASVPALWCASYLAEKNIVIVGDFLQLPPIVMADTPMAQKWLGKDIFFHSGMQAMAKAGKAPHNFVMLNDQFRMEKAIANIANMYYGDYGGLKSNDFLSFRKEARKKFYEWYSGGRSEDCIRLIDTESLHAWVTGVPQGKSHSRLNCFSAAVSVELAFKCLEHKIASLSETEKEASVLIVAPYKPHVNEIQKLINQKYKELGLKETCNLIRVGTIHSFQGSEADIVIFDLVIDEPHWKANLFMPGEEINEDLRKMFNVAVTRAKFKLFVVGNFAYCRKRAKDNALAELLGYLIDKKKYIPEDAKKLLPGLVFSKSHQAMGEENPEDGFLLCREETFMSHFLQDIHSFRNRMIIYSPFMTENRLSSLLPDFADAVNQGRRILVVTKAMDDRNKSELVQYQKCEKELRSIGVQILHKKGMHEKLIFVDDRAVWMGSLNALSFTGLTGEVMHRHTGKELMEEYAKLFDIPHICEVADRSNEQKCPICGSEMLARESDNGGIYWECVNKDYSRKAEQQYPEDGIMRCKCGAPYKFVMKKEPRWVCTDNPAHYQKMRESDLKLDKMRALIPTKKELREVERYFAEKRKEWEKAHPTSKPKKAKPKPTAQKKSKESDVQQLSLFTD